MPSIRALAIACVTSAILVWAVTPARADGFISPFVGFNFGGDSANCASLTSCNEKRLDWGASIGTTRGIFGFEEDIAYAPDFFGKSPGTNKAVLNVMIKLMLVVPAGPVQPYALVGLGLIRPHV